MSEDYIGIGRRKTAVAQASIKRGTGVITVNGRAFEEYFLVVIFYLSAVVDADWIERLLAFCFFV